MLTTVYYGTKLLIMKDIDFEDYSLEELDEMDEYSQLSQDLDDEGEMFQEKLDMYRAEI